MRHHAWMKCSVRVNGCELGFCALQFAGLLIDIKHLFVFAL